MCGKKPPAPPAVVQRDPVAEQKKAEADAQMTANTDGAARRRRRNFSSSMSATANRANLLGSAGQASAPANKTLLAQAKPA